MHCSVYDTTQINDGPTVSGHAYSSDGVTWKQSAIQPYLHFYTTTDGLNHTISTRERPKLFFNAAGDPSYLLNGICTAVSCAPTPAGECTKHLFIMQTSTQCAIRFPSSSC